MSPTRVVSNLFKLHRGEYIAPRVPRVLAIGEAKYLAVAGSGTLNSDAVTAQSRTLRQLVATLRDILVTRHRDFTGTKLECIWQDDLRTPAPDATDWKLCVRVPEFVTTDDLRNAIHNIVELGGVSRDKVEGIQMEAMPAGQCLQALHRGPYDTLPRTVAELQQYAQCAKLALSATRHAIYLSEPRHVPPEHLRTVLRIPLENRDGMAEMAVPVSAHLADEDEPIEGETDGWLTG